MGSIVQRTEARWRTSARIESLPIRALSVLVTVGVCLVLAPAALATPPSFTWNGEASTSETQWEIGANWVGGLAPEEQAETTNPAVVGNLEFPELSAPACASGPETKACYHSQNDHLSVSAEALKIDDGDNYILSGSEALELGKGGLTASPEGHTSGARDEIGMPLELTAPQTWRIAGAGAGDNGVLLEDDVSEAAGAAGGLHIVQSKESALVLGADAEVELGPLTSKAKTPPRPALKTARSNCWAAN